MAKLSKRLGVGMASVAVAALVVGPSWAKEPSKARPAVLQKLIDCRAITDDAARLACFDTGVAQLEAAESRNDVVVIDKEQVKTARKGLFGLSLPDLGIFGSKKDDEPDQELMEIKSTIKSARENALGKWVIILEDGAKWVQTESARIFEPKPGQPIRIRKAAMGGFFANVNEQTAIRVARQN